MRLPSMEEWRRFAVQHQMQSSRRAVRDGRPDCVKDETTVVNELLFQRLVTVYTAMIEANAFANNWIVIDRVIGKSPTADLLLELAMGRTTTTPTIIVIDTLERLFNFESPGAESQWASLEQLVQMSSTIGAVGEGRATKAMQFMYTPSDFLDATKYYNMPSPRKSDDGTTPLGKKWEAHYLQSLFSYATHYILFQTAADAMYADDIGRVGAVYSNGGDFTFERLQLRIAQGTPLVMFHNSGGVTQAFASLQRMLMRGVAPSATALMAKAEVVSTDQWAEDFGLTQVMMMKELRERAPSLYRTTVVSVDLVKDTSEDILETITACFSAVDGGMPELGLGDAEAMVVRSAWKRHFAHFENAKRFRKRSVFFNVSTMFLATLTTLASVLFIHFDKAVKNDNSNEELRLTNRCNACSDPGNQDTDFCTPRGGEVDGEWPATGCVGLHTEGADETALKIMQYSVVVLPIVTVLIATMQARFRPGEKFAACLVAASEITAEIYKYRTRALDYDEANFRKEGNAANAARQLFTATVSEKYANALVSEVSKGGALRMKGPTNLSLNDEEDTMKLDEAVLSHMRNKLLDNCPRKRKPPTPKLVYETEETPSSQGIGHCRSICSNVEYFFTCCGVLPRPSSCFCRLPGVKRAEQSVAKAAEKVLEEARTAFDDDDDDEEDKPSDRYDDMVTSFSLEDYVDYRTRPMAHHFENVAPKLSKVLQLLELLAILSTSSAAILGIFRLPDWVALPIAISTFFSALIAYFNLYQRTAVCNAAVKDLHGLLTKWEGLSLVNRRTRQMKAEAVDITESSYIAVIIAKCGGLGSSKSNDDGDDGDEEDGKKGGGDGGEAPAPAHAPSWNACPKCGYDGSGGGGTVGQQMMGNAAIATAAVGGSSRVASNGISAAVATVP
uniref:SMODS and SLOG-associating 2TM effector domain-containing protein n=3 Tax=Emiliania huxleyi TaxID=2903 RepID=A0A7S3X487_EMIHU